VWSFAALMAVALECSEACPPSLPHACCLDVLEGPVKIPPSALGACSADQQWLGRAARW